MPIMSDNYEPDLRQCHLCSEPIAIGTEYVVIDRFLIAHVGCQTPGPDTLLIYIRGLLRRGHLTEFQTAQLKAWEVWVVKAMDCESTRPPG